MDNRQKIRNTFDTKLDKDKIYNNIIKSDEAKYINFFKISLAPICLMLILGIVSFIYFNRPILERPNIKGNSSEIKQEELKDSKKEDMSNNFCDIIGIWEDFKFSELIKEEPSLAKIKFPNDIKEKRCIKDYEVSNKLSSRVVIYRDKNNAKGDFLGYNLMFGNDNKDIEIYVSEKIECKARCTNIKLSEFSTYKILGIEFKMISYSNKYIVLFKYNNLYWDIETYNMPAQELIDVICSIIF